MRELSLKTTRRETTGKGNARSLRREGVIPAVLYGANTKPLKLSVELAGVQRIFRANKSSQFLLSLDVDGDVKKVTIKELQKHPMTSEVLHIDFYEVSMNKKIKVSVPISTRGISKGVELGGMLQIVRREIDILCLPNEIPDSIVVDISNLDIGDSFHISDLSLSDGIEVFGEGKYTILTVLNQKSTEESAEEEEEEESSEDIGSV